MIFHTATSALRETIDAPLSPLDTLWLEAMIQTARKSLSEAAFLSAWAEGRSWSIEQGHCLCAGGLSYGVITLTDSGR